MGGVIRKRKIADKIRKPWERERLVMELDLVGKYGLRNKKELRTITAMARKDKSQAKKLLITTSKAEFMTEGRALLDRLAKLGLIFGVDLNDSESIKTSLKDVLNFEPSKYLDRRLQTIVFRLGLAKNIHLARNLITQKQIILKGRVNNKPGMLVMVDNEGYVEINPNSAAGKGKKGRFARKHQATPAEGEE